MLDLSLTHYDPKKGMTVTSDASNLGLGAVILHKESYGQVKAIEHVLRTPLTAKKGTAKSKKSL